MNKLLQSEHLSNEFQFLLDECVHGGLRRRLQAEGSSVLCMSEYAPGADDPTVLHIALERRLILVTRDKDFGDLVFRDKHLSYGVVCYRLPFSLEVIDIVSSFLLSNMSKLPGMFTIIDKNGIRSKPLPLSIVADRIDF